MPVYIINEISLILGWIYYLFEQIYDFSGNLVALDCIPIRSYKASSALNLYVQHITLDN